MLFKEPAVTLVENTRPTTIAYPTFWFDQLPFLRANQYQDAWARTMKVNLLASNLREVITASTGSGIFTPTGPVVHEYTLKGGGHTVLMVANVPRRPGAQCPPEVFKRTYPDHVDLGLMYSRLDKWLPSHFTMMQLSGTSGKVTKCDKGLCCTVDYEGIVRAPGLSYFLVMRKGRHDRTLNNVCDEACAVAAVRRGRYSKTGSKFKKLTLTMTNVQTKYVFPSLLTDQWDITGDYEAGFGANNGTYEMRVNTQRPITVASVYGRCYDNDPEYKPMVG